MPSVLALIESGLAIGAYAAIAVEMRTTLHLAFAALVAPILLLRTPRSVDRALTIFEDLSSPKPIEGAFVFVGGAVLMLAMAALAVYADCRSQLRSWSDA